MKEHGRTEEADGVATFTLSKGNHRSHIVECVCKPEGRGASERANLAPISSADTCRISMFPLTPAQAFEARLSYER